MEKKFDLSKEYNKEQNIKNNFYAIITGLACVVMFIAIVHDSMDKDTILGALAFVSLLAIGFAIYRFFDIYFLTGYKKIHTLVYTLYSDRILYETNKNNEVIFIDEIKSINLHIYETKSLRYCELYIYTINGNITCAYSDQGDFHEYLKKYLNERGVNNDL